MKFISKARFFSGIAILLFLFLSYFVKFNIDVGFNYITEDRLLGIVIFHNFLVFMVYVLIASLLIFTGLKRIKFA